MDLTKLKGIVPPIITPLNEREEVDEGAFRALLNHCYEKGIHGIFVAGTNGECMALTQKERNHAIQIALDEVGGKMPVMAGVMDSSTKRVIENIKALEQMGGEIAVVTPAFYWKSPSDKEMITHFEEVAKSTKIAIFAYNIPPFTGMNHAYRDFVVFGSWLDDSRMSGGGIHLFQQDETTGKLTRIGHYADHLAAGYLCVSSDRQYLYALNEIKHRPDYSETGGSVHAFRLNLRETGADLRDPPSEGRDNLRDAGADLRDNPVEYMGGTSSAGSFPCYLALDRTDRVLLAPNYGSEGDDFNIKVERNPAGGFTLTRCYDEPSIAVMPIAADGSPAAVKNLYRLAGEPTRISRWLQSTPHPHSLNISPSNRLALVTDRGCDSLILYAFNAEDGTLETADTLKLEQGIGPRNSVFHPTLPFLFVLCEIMPRVGSCRYDEAMGKLTPIGFAATIPEDEIEDAGRLPQDLAGFLGYTHPADIQIHPNGRFLYATNRSQDLNKNTIAIFAIDQTNGSLAAIGQVPSKGTYCRICGFDPSGKYLYVGNQQSGNVETFAADPESGLLTDQNQSVSVPRAVCIKSFRIYG